MKYQCSDQHKLERQQYYQGYLGILGLVEIHLLGNNQAFRVHHNPKSYQNMGNLLDNWYGTDTL
jgi:hypothetical protein